MSLLISLLISLKSIVSDMRIVMHAGFHAPFYLSTYVHPFTLSWCLSLKLRCVLCRKQKGFCFLICSTSLCLDSPESRTEAINIKSIERYMLITTIVFLVFIVCVVNGTLCCSNYSSIFFFTVSLLCSFHLFNLKYCCLYFL